jgi:hypothetical protein
MRSNVFMACALILTSMAAVPQALPSAKPVYNSTTTATLTTIFPIANETFCGVDSVTIPFTGQVHIAFHSTLPMDFYILQTLNYIPCGQHLRVEDLASDGCILAEWDATELDLNQSLPSTYFIFLVAWGKTGDVNGATATIVMSGGVSNASTTQVNLTPNTTTSPFIPNPSTSGPSLQMPQPPQTGAATQPSTFTIPEAALGAVMVAAVALYLLVRRHNKQSQKEPAPP